jgi:hypothetical protein
MGWSDAAEESLLCLATVSKMPDSASSSEGWWGMVGRLREAVLCCWIWIEMIVRSELMLVKGCMKKKRESRMYQPEEKRRMGSRV